MSGQRKDMLYWLSVTLVALAGLTTRVLLAMAAVAVSRDAAADYLPLARHWQHGVASKAFAGGIPPLYPILTGYLARIVGNVEPAGRIVSIVGGMLVLLFVFLLAYRLAGRRTALIALALVAFHPYLCEHAADVGTDSLAAGFLVGTVYGVCAYLVTFSFWNVLLAAAMLAGLALTRPEGFAYAPIALLVMLFWPTATPDRTADKETRRQGDKETVGGQPAAHREIGGRSFFARRTRHVGLLVLILLGLCVPRLISVHRKTGTWALDTRQRTWSARILKALRTGEPSYGQWRIWSKGGLDAAGRTIEATGAAFGPAGLLFGIYGLFAARRLRRRRAAMVIVLFVLYGYVLILVGNRISKRYLLGPAAMWQVWTAIGIVLLFLRVRVLLARRTGSHAASGTRKPEGLKWHPGRMRRLPVTAGLIIACLQLPWAARRLHAPSLADRRMGEWIAANFPPGTRIMAMDPIAPWYGQAVKVNLPIFKPSRLTPMAMALRANQVSAAVILVDARGPIWCPDIWPRLQRGQWRYGRILHTETGGSHTLYLLDMSNGAQAEKDARRHRRKARRRRQRQAAKVAASHPAPINEAKRPPRRARKRAGIEAQAASTSMPADAPAATRR